MIILSLKMNCTMRYKSFIFNLILTSICEIRIKLPRNVSLLLKYEPFMFQSDNRECCSFQFPIFRINLKLYFILSSPY